MKTFKFSLVLRTRENTDVFITLDDNIYGIHSKRVNILYAHPVWCLWILYSLRKHAYFKYTENFTSKNWKFSDKNYDIFHVSA